MSISNEAYSASIRVDDELCISDCANVPSPQSTATAAKECLYKIIGV